MKAKVHAITAEIHHLPLIYHWLGLFLCFKFAGWLLAMFDLNMASWLGTFGQFLLGSLSFIGIMAIPPQSTHTSIRNPNRKNRRPTDHCGRQPDTNFHD